MSIKKENNRLSGWDGAIADAKKRIAKLQTVIEVCKEKKRSGEPWPGSSNKVTNARGFEQPHGG